MPIKKVKGGYKFGNSGHVYTKRSQAVNQMKAIFASGYKSKSKLKSK